MACQKEEDPEARAVMIDTLSVWRFDADRFLEMLIPALGAENAALQSSVMNALILLDRPSETSVPALVRVLEGKDLPLARRAASTLGHLGSDARAAVPALERLAKDEAASEEDRAAFAEVLAGIRP